MFYRGLAAVAAAFVASAPAGAAVYTADVAINVPPSAGTSIFGTGSKLNDPIASLAPGDVLSLTFHLTPELARDYKPGWVRAGLVFGADFKERFNVGEATFQVVGTGDFTQNGLTLNLGQNGDYWRFFKLGDDSNFHGGSISAIQLSYAVTEAVTSPLTAVVFESAVPEPRTWAMMLGGFGLAGIGVRRRSGRQHRDVRV